MTIREQVFEYIEHLSFREDISVKTVDTYKKDLINFCEYFERVSISIQDLRLEQIEEYIDSLIEKEYSFATIKRKIVPMKSLFSFSGKELLIPSYESRVVKQVNLSEDPLIIREEDFREIVSLCEKEDTSLAIRDIAILEMIWNTGINSSECRGLNLNSFIKSGEEIFVRTIFRKRENLTLVGLDAIRALYDYIENSRYFLTGGNNNEPSLFLSTKGKRISRQRLYNIVKDRAANAGFLDVSPLVLRNSSKQNKG